MEEKSEEIISFPMMQVSQTFHSDDFKNRAHRSQIIASKDNLIKQNYCQFSFNNPLINKKDHRKKLISRVWRKSLELFLGQPLTTFLLLLSVSNFYQNLANPLRNSLAIYMKFGSIFWEGIDCSKDFPTRIHTNRPISKKHFFRFRRH